MLAPCHLDLQREVSDVLFITGLLCKGRSDEDVRQFLSTCPEEYTETKVDMGSPGGGKLWVRYASIEDATKAQSLFHQQPYQGTSVMSRFELGFDASTGKRIVSRNSIHTTCIRRIQQRRGQTFNSQRDTNMAKKQQEPVHYSHKAILVG